MSEMQNRERSALVWRRKSCPACGHCHLVTYNRPIGVTVICQGPIIYDCRLIRKQCRDRNCQAVIAVGCYWYPDGSNGSSDDVEPTQRANGRAKQRELTFFDDPDEAFIRVKPHLFVEVSLLQQLRVWLLRLRSSNQGISETVLATSGSCVVGLYPWLACRQHADLRGLLDPKGQWLQQAFDILAILEQTQSRMIASELDEQHHQQQHGIHPSDEDPEVEQAPVPRKLFTLVEHSSNSTELAAAGSHHQNTDAACSMDNCGGTAEARLAAESAEEDEFNDSVDDCLWDQANMSDFDSDDPGDLDQGEAAAAAAEPAGAFTGIPFEFAGEQVELPSHAGADNGLAGDAGGQQEQQPEQEHWQQQQEPGQQPAVGRHIPKGTVDELLRQVIVKDILASHGNIPLTDHRRCFCSGASQPHPLTLIVDCTTNIRVRACAVPDCKEPPLRDQMWCQGHHQVNHGCQVVVCGGGSDEWCPCDQQARGSEITCSRHRSMDSKGGRAAGFEVRGYITPGHDRRDKVDTQALRLHQQHKCGSMCWITQAQATPLQQPPTPAAAAAAAGVPTGTPAVLTPEEVRPAAAPPASASAGRARPRSKTHTEAAAADATAAGNTASTSTPIVNQPGTSSTPSSSSHGWQPDAVFVGGKATRPVLVCSCAHCGSVVGFSLLWHGAPETSYRGLQDVLEALDRMLQRTAKLPQPDAAAAAAAAGASGSISERIVVIYNDAAAMQSHWQQLEPSQQQKFVMIAEHVTWVIDPFRFLPAWSAAVRQVAESSADDRECSTPQPPSKRRRVGPGAASSSQPTSVTPAQIMTGSRPAAGAKSGSQAGVTEAQTTGSQAGVTEAQTRQHALQCLSPFRHQLQGHLWRDVKVPRQSQLFLGIAKLLQLLPSPLDERWHQQCAIHDDTTQPRSLRWLLCRAYGARLTPGVVSYHELAPFIVDALLPVGRQADLSQRRTMSKRLLQHIPDSHERLFFQFSPPSNASTRWKVRVMAMLVDAEAVEGLWRQLQPGTTLSLKSQTHAMVELAAWLQMHDRKQRLYQQYILQRQQEHLRGSGVISADLHLPTLKQWKVMNLRLTAQLNLVTGPPTQKALEFSQLGIQLDEQRQLVADLEQHVKQLQQHRVELEQQHEQRITDLQQQVTQLKDELDACTGGSSMP